MNSNNQFTLDIILENLKELEIKIRIQYLKELINNRSFRIAHEQLLQIKQLTNISDEEITEKLINLGTNNIAFTEFVDYHRDVNNLYPVGPSAPLPRPSAPPANNTINGGSKSPNKKRLSNKKKSKSRVIRRRPSLKRKKSRSGKGNKQTKKIIKL